MSGKSDYLTSRLRTGNSSYLTSRLTNIDPPREEDDEFFGQGFVSDFGIGTGNLVSSIGTLYGLASGNMDNAISQLGDETTSFYEDLQTEDQKRRQREFQQYVDGGADELDKAGRAIVGTITDPSLTFSFLTQQIPLLVGGGAAGLAAKGVTGSVRAGQAAGILSGAGLNAGDIAGGMYSDVMQLPEDVLDKNDAYRVRKAEIGAEEARKELALEGARNTALAVGALSTVTAGALPSTIEKTLIGGAAEGTTRIGNLGRGFISEALQEAVEEGGGQAIANLNIQPLDPSRSLTEGVGQAAAQGGLLGGLLGGGVGVLTPTDRIGQAAERGANQARAEGGDALDQSARAAQEAAQVSTTDTINGRSGQTTIEMQGNQSDVEALRERFGINQGRVEPVTLTPEETTIPTDEPLQATQFDPLLIPTPFEPLDALTAANRSINRAVVLNARDQRRALRDGDQASADALEDDSVKLRALQSRIVSARELQALPESERVAGQSEMIENILRDVSEAINQESAARESFSYVNVLEGELLPRIDETLQALRGVGALTPRQIAEGRQIAYQPPTDFEVDPEGQAGRPGERARIEMEREAALEPVERDFNALAEAYEEGDTQPLVDELNAIADRLSDLQTRRTGTAVTTDDDVLTAIAKAGGIDIQEAISQGLDPADNPGRGRLSLFRREGGMTFDGVAEFLAENGFTQPVGDTFEAGVQDANTALEIVADALNARADGNLTFLNSGKAAEIQEAQMRLDVAEQALFELKQTGQNLSPEDEVLIAQLYEEMYDEVYGRADTGRVARSAEEEIAPPRDNVIPGGDRGSEIQPQLEPRAPQGGSRELRQSDGPPQGRQSVTPQTGPQGPVFDFSAEKERLTQRLANFKTQDLTDLLKEAGLRTVGNRQDKIDRIITFREAGALLNQYDSYESAEQALVQDKGLSPDTIARYADSLRRSGDRKISPQQTKTNLFSVYNALNQAGMTKIPQYTPETQARRDEEEAIREAESAQREQARASEDEQIQSWLEENRDQVTQWWGNATQEDRRRMLEDVASYRVESGQSANIEAARAFGVGEGRQQARRLNTDDITKLPKSVSDAIIRWAPFNWDRFTGAEQTETLPAAEGIQPPPGDQLEVLELPPERGEPKQPSEAPEHRGADRGVGKPELDAMVEAFNSAQEEMYRDGEQVTRVFEGPATEDVVRLKNKVDNYVSESGYMSKSQAETTIAGWKRNAIDQGIDPEKRRINGNKVVLSLFDLTGSWSRPWAEAGYDVYTFDIQDDEFMGDINNFSTQFFVDNFNSFEGKEVYAVLAACPCTDFASSGARHFAAKDEDGRTYASVQLVQQTLATIEFFKPQIWAIENPVGRIQRMTGLPDWRLSFDPYHLGEDYTKKTLLWGRFNADLPIAPTEPTAGSKMHQKYGGKSLATKNARSETPEGFSYAFFDANNQIDHPVMSAQNRFDMMNKSVIEDAVSDYGMTEDEIFSIIDDDYYIDLDYDQADMRLRERFDSMDSEGLVFDDDPEPPRSREDQERTNGYLADYIRSQFPDVRSESIERALNAGMSQEEVRRNIQNRYAIDGREGYGESASNRLDAMAAGRSSQDWTPEEDNFFYESYGRVTRDGRPGREDPTPRKNDYSIGRALPVEGRPGVFAREIRSPKGELVGVVEVTEQQSTALYLDTAGSYDVFTPRPDDEMFGGNNYPTRQHQQAAIYAVMDRVLREKKGEPVPPAEFSGKTEAPLLESYTEQDLQDRAAVDMEAGERRAQIDRERELFDLDSGQGTIAGTTDPTQTDGNQGGLFRRDRELGINRGATPRPVITDEEFNTVIDRIVGDNPEARARIVAVDSFADLPEPLRIAARKQGSDGSDVDAVTHRGQIYIVRGRMRSKARMERTLLHEGTHVGINAMYADEGVRRAMNRMYVAMGGAKGFNKMAKDLGIESQIAPYREGLSRYAVENRANFSEQVRNEILVNEMLAYVGERGSKTFQDRVREVIGAIRNWLRKNGLMTLANMRVSDITYIAKKARENGLRSETARGDGEPAFSIVAEQPRARQTDLGLYSNAEQILLDEGDKIFKPSNKNPEGRVRGDQILSFLKARGLKKEEATYVDLEAELVDLGSVQSFTRDEVIQILRDNAPDLYADVRTGIYSEDDRNIGITDGEILDDQENYQHIIEDMRTDIFDAGADDTDNFSLADLVTALYDYDKDIMKNMASVDFPNMSMEAVDSALIADIFKAYVSETDNSLLPQRLVDAYGENLVDDTIVELAEQRYLDDPYYRHSVYNADDDYIGEIIGNDDTGYILKDSAGNRFAESQAIYDIDEARVQFQMWAEDSGLIGEAAQGDTQYFSYLKIDESDINDYREVVVSLEDNRLADSTYYGGHFDVENMLFHVLATDRSTEFGDTLAIEETQSDWHSAIRRAGGTYDPVKGDQLLAEAEELRAEEKAASTKNSEMLMAYGARIEGIPGTRKTTDFLSNVSNLGKFLNDVAPKLTDAGIWEMAAIVFNSREGGNTRLINITQGRMGGQLIESMVADIMKIMVESPIAQKYWTIDIKAQEPAAVEKLLRDNFREIFDFRINSQELTGYDPLRDEKMSSRATQDITPEVAELRQMAQEFAEDYAQFRELVARVNGLEKKGRALKTAPPESPFRDDKYLDLVAKIMLREAITERKTGIAFSKGDRVQNRWSEKYDYEAIYNRKLKKAMDKLMGMPAQSMDERGRLETGDDVSSDGFWAYPITPEFAENVKENGLPMFRRDGSDGRIYPKKPAEERLRDKFLRVLQDKMLPVYRTQQAIEVANERELDISENPYLTEELFYGKTEEDLRQLELRFVEPLIRAMKEAGVSSDQLNDYLYAKHAPERNKRIREINPEFEGPGSGMSDAEAAEIIGQYTGDKLQQMEDLADRVYQMTQLTRDLLRASGLQADEVTDSWEATYENYVPLRGFADNEVDAKGGRIPTGRGFDIRGKEAKRAYGRQSRAQGPLAQVIADLTGKIIRNRKNEVSKAFLQMVENNPDPSQWQVFTDANPDPAAFRGPNANKRTAQMEMARSDAYLGVKRDGVVHYIKVRDRKLLNAMQNVGPEQLGAATRIVGGVTRFLSSVNTAYDPTFVLTNFARDINAALINIAGEQTKEGGLIEGKRIGAKVAKGTPKAIAAIRSYARNKKVGDGDTEYERYFKEFLDAGAKTGYFDSPDLDVLEKRLAARINQGEGALAKGKAGAKWIGEFVSDYNLAVENGVRLSAYIESRKAGIDKSKAASLAKNLTVNFNRKGSAGAHINSWYMFFNAAVQGLKQFTNTLSPISLDAEGNVQVQRRLNRAQKIAGGLVGIAYAAAVFNREIGGEDDDGEALYDKINPAIRERNLILMKPGYGEIGDDGFLSEVAYFKIPLPYGYNFFYTIGTAVEAMQNGSARRKENALGEVFNSFVTAFSPISVHANAAISASPTVFVPAFELASNTNFFGSDIVRENFPSGPQRSAAHNYWNSTKEPYVAIAQFLNDTVGGGSEYRSGSLGFMFDISTDISPDVIEHITEFGLGGIYRAGMGALDAAERVTSGREIDPTRAPFLSKVFGRDDSDYADQERFYDTRQLIINAKKEREDARGQERIAADQANNFIHRLYQPMLATEKFLRQQRDRRDKVRDDDRLTEAERDAQLEKIRERMDDRIDRFNRRYQEHLEKYGN